MLHVQIPKSDDAMGLINSLAEYALVCVVL